MILIVEVGYALIVNSTISTDTVLMVQDYVENRIAMDSGLCILSYLLSISFISY